MTSAPSVNQMRFLSSSALEKADQLILAASCSAADAIDCAPIGASRWKRGRSANARSADALRSRGGETRPII